MIFIENNNLDPALNHAIELYVMDKYNDDIFMLWRNNPCILIGRYQNINLEVNLEFTASNGIEVVRRLSGGGAIYCDTDNMQYTFITKKPQTKIDDSFKNFAKPVVNALKSLGLNAEFTGRNDIQINGLKVSGNAQFYKNGKVVHHGTLLFKANTYNLSNALKARDIKFKGKEVQSIAARIGFISNFIDMSVTEFKDYVEAFIKKEYNINSVTVLTSDDMEEIKKIKSEIFGTKEWNYGIKPLNKNRKSEKYSCGIVEIDIDYKDGKIQDITIEGDFFGELGIDNLCNILKGSECSRQAVTETLKNIEIDKYIKSMEKEVFIDYIMRIIEADTCDGKKRIC
ncbi:lipoate--protein ligase [Treponema pedis]|uniref:lipoate--protein ligase n=1 Tax=Treponema pedis TaxID=409322 RepID=A0A7S7AWQ3_9SPIR|nr:lipoate--protein ligase [Treponema pedis]QOW60861.1 lipoate--protein ligase [Treponema pedis]